MLQVRAISMMGVFMSRSLRTLLSDCCETRRQLTFGIRCATRWRHRRH
jgi:hypothetical protein